MGQDESSIVDASAAPHRLKARTLAAVADYIAGGECKKVVVLTGAGISTAAGIPDFRSPNTGLYSNLARLNLPYAEAVFDIDYFRQHPEPFYVLARELYPGKFHPTVSHAFIALLARKGLLQMLFTQNIDCLERAAGVPTDRIVEAHGSFATQRCIECKTEFPDDKMREHVFDSRVPRCAETGCGGIVKPDIVFFGESLPPAFGQKSHLAAMADVVLIIGTSLSVSPFAGLPEMAGQGVPRVLFNMERVGRIGTRADDVVELGPCDDGIRTLAAALGWTDELEQLWRSLVGDEEANRQLLEQKRQPGATDDEMQKLTEGVEAVLRLDEAKEPPEFDANERDSATAAGQETLPPALCEEGGHGSSPETSEKPSAPADEASPATSARPTKRDKEPPPPPPPPPAAAAAAGTVGERLPESSGQHEQKLRA